MEILFGKKTGKSKEMKDISLHSYKSKRLKVSKMISAYKCRDKKKGLGCDLTIEFMLNNIVNKNCFYCDTIINVGCDRIDDKKGHLIDNVIPCCYICNVVRSNIFTVDEMKILGVHIKDILNKRIVSL